jgi:hypothetical protein
MDGQRFDELTRRLAEGAPRRSVLKGIAGGALGLLGARTLGIRSAAGQQCVAPGAACQRNRDCCEGRCSDQGVCFCQDPAEPVIGCSCITGTQNPCGAMTAVCCPTGNDPGGPGSCTPASVGCEPTEPCPGVVCDPTAVLDETTCECVCPLPTVPCGDGQCAHCGAIFQVDPETCECVCPGTEACPCERNGDCADGFVCCDDPTTGEGSCRATCEDVCAIPGQACLRDRDCCEGQCSDEGACYCLDPSRPIIGCSCITGTENPCGDSTAVCCPTGSQPGGPGVCVSASVGCEPTGGACTTGTADACAEGFECCANPGSPPGGPGTCTPIGTNCARQGCAGPGHACLYDSECCAGTCDEGGFCFCVDPDEPARECLCTTGTEAPCVAGYVCCETEDLPGGEGVCVSEKVGCKDDDDDGGADATKTPVTTLPSTGIGEHGGGDAGWLAPATLAGAGAALIAHRLLRRKAEPEPGPEIDPTGA